MSTVDINLKCENPTWGNSAIFSSKLNININNIYHVAYEIFLHLWLLTKFLHIICQLYQNFEKQTKQKLLSVFYWLGYWISKTERSCLEQSLRQGLGVCIEKVLHRKILARRESEAREGRGRTWPHGNSILGLDHGGGLWNIDHTTELIPLETKVLVFYALIHQSLAVAFSH